MEKPGDLKVDGEKGEGKGELEVREREGGEGVEGSGEEKEKRKEKRGGGRQKGKEGGGRERSGSLTVLDLLKRGEKRKERQEIEREGEEVEVWRKNRKLGWSPEGQEKGEWMDIVREIREGVGEIKKDINGKKEGREELGELREWIEEMRKDWKKEREELRRRVEQLERKVEEYEKAGRERVGSGKSVEEKEKEKMGRIERRAGGETKTIEERVKKMEIEEDKRRREVRKKNIIIRGVKVKEEGQEGLRKEVEEIVKVTGADVRVVEVRKIGNKEKEGGEMAWVRFESVEEKLKVMKGKGKLRERREWIADDLTERERRVEWWIRREAERSRREGKRVRVGYMKVWIEDKLWVWDELKDELREWKDRGGSKGERLEGGGERDKEFGQVF